MIPPFAGAVILMAAVFGVGAGLSLLAVGKLLSHRSYQEIGQTLGMVCGFGYAAAWVGGLLTGPPISGPVGRELDFCGLDCDLHVSVVDWSPGKEFTVRVRFRSAARRLDYFVPGLGNPLVQGRITPAVPRRAPRSSPEGP